MSTIKREIGDVAKQLLEFGFSGSAILLPAMLPDDEAESVYGSRFEIDDESETIWYFKSLRKPGTVICTVQRKAKKVTGTCRSFEKNRAGACGHSAYYCKKNDLPIPGPYLLADRLEPYQIIHSVGKTAVTLDNIARERMLPSVRQKIYELCRMIRDPRPSTAVRCGQPRIPYRAIVYAFLVQVAEGLTDHNMAAHLSDDAWYSELTGNRSSYKKKGALSDETLSKVIWSYPLYAMMPQLLANTAEAGRLMDRLVGLDASGFGTTRLANWFVKQYASGPNKGKNDEGASSQAPGESAPSSSRARMRDSRGFIKVHTIEGMESGLIYALNCTLDFGAATADTMHFQSLVKKALDVNPQIRLTVADKGYWNQYHFGFMQGLDVLLMVMIKDGVKPENADVGREMIAYLEHLRLNHPGVYRTFYRYRQSIESAFSAQKRVTRHVRRRVRKKEQTRVNRAYPPEGKDIDWSSFGAQKPSNYDDVRMFASAIIAQELVGRAQVNEAHAMAIAANLRQIVRWEMQYGLTMNLAAKTAFKRMRRIFVPWAA